MEGGLEGGRFGGWEEVSKDWGVKLWVSFEAGLGFLTYLCFSLESFPPPVMWLTTASA